VPLRPYERLVGVGDRDPLRWVSLVCLAFSTVPEGDGLALTAGLLAVMD
jgi:hypothetical protein